MIKYYLYPEHEVKVCNNITKETVSRIKEEIKEQNIQYIYIVSTDEKLNQAINDEFKTKVEIKENTLYKIQINENNIELKEKTLD